MVEKTCKNCSYFGGHHSLPSIGHCYANPPVIVQRLVDVGENDPERDPVVFDDRIACRFFELKEADNG